MENPYRLDLSKYSTHNIIAENIGESGLVLDVGCNDGYMGSISSKTNRFYGIDYSKESITHAKKVYLDAATYDLNDLRELPWDIKFDVIIFADVLEHVLYPKRVLEFFSQKYLKEGGKIIVSLPNIANWQMRINLLFGKFEYTSAGILDRTHIHLYTFHSAKSLVTDSGLEITHIFSGASLLGPVVKILPYLKTLLATGIIIVCQKK